MCRGMYAFALGLAKKVLIADTFSKFVSAGYSHLWDLNANSAVLWMVCYALQIYFDFSGYCDMAYGIGYMFNVQLPVNFNSPYKALSIADFWDRWHMTLTRFFTKYVYIPLGGNRKGVLRTYVNVLLVFLISGVWHGAAWSFILWGILHGIWMVGNKLFGRYFEKLPRFIRWLGTFIGVTFLWSLFRSNDVDYAFILWKQLLHGGIGPFEETMMAAFDNMMEVELLCRFGIGSLLGDSLWILLLAFVVCIVLACVFLRNTQEKVLGMKLTKVRMVITVLLIVWSILSLSDVSEFLYFNF